MVSAVGLGGLTARLYFGVNPEIFFDASKVTFPDLIIGGSKCFAYGIAIFLPRALFRNSVIAELPIASVVAMHYYVDARVWKFKDYPKRGKWLKLAG